MAMRVTPWGVAAICLLGQGVSALLRFAPEAEAATWDNWDDVPQDAGLYSGLQYDDPPAGDAGVWRKDEFAQQPASLPEDAGEGAGGVPFDPPAVDTGAWRREDFASQPASMSDANPPAEQPKFPKGGKGSGVEDPIDVDSAGPHYPIHRLPVRAPADVPRTPDARAPAGLPRAPLDLPRAPAEYPRQPADYYPRQPAAPAPQPAPVDEPPEEQPGNVMEPPGGGMCQNCNGVQFTDEEKHSMLEGTDGTKNLCMLGHLVPELFVIGSISGGTTSFCSALEHSPAMDWPINPGKNFDRRIKPTRWKEGHYFDKWFTNGIDLLINDYHDCDPVVRKVAVEGSARYALDRRVPGRIVQWYGINLASKVKFIHIFRDPVARFHSHYWKAIDKIWCVSLSLYSIHRVTQMAMEGDAKMFEDGGAFGGCGDLLEAGYYTKQISYWWEFYPSQQFIYIPFRLALQINKVPDPTYPKPHRFIWQMLGVRGKEPTITYENSNQHGKLEEDLDPDQLRAFRQHLYQTNSPHLIATMVAPSNATLYGFTEERTVPAVAAWLASNW